jgi:undecaprenyl diphosphate synthase
MQHLAIIPDGNRRWAKKNKLAAVMGHRSGMDAVKHAISMCLENGIKYLSLYTFSLENFNRSDEEKRYLFNLLAEGFSAQLPELIENGIKVKFIGDASYFPEVLKKTIKNIEQETKHLDALQLNLLFCYGGRGEMVSAFKLLAEQVKQGTIQADDITEETIRSALWTSGIPDPELVIRTGGNIRLSNLLLFQSAYSELMFLDCFWPEITKERLQQCVNDFKNVQRNFGS